MSIAKAVVSGVVYKAPEKRFTQSNIAVADFVIDINPQEETLLRVIALGGLAQRAAEQIKQGETVVVEGRLQVETVQNAQGQDKKVVVLGASGFDVFGTSKTIESSSENLVKFSEVELGENLIGEDEIPF